MHLKTDKHAYTNLTDNNSIYILLSHLILELVGIYYPNYTLTTNMSRFTATDLTSFISPYLQELKGHGEWLN